MTLPLYAQWIPRHFGADTSLRVECLMGTQTLGNNGDAAQLSSLVTVTNPNPPPATLSSVKGFPNPIERLRIDFNNTLLVLDGVAELSPAPSLSGRGRASVSVLNPNKNITLSNGPVPVAVGTNLTPPPSGTSYGWNGVPSEITPQFWLWEAAGLYNLYEDIYRFSLLAGYRQESWSYPASNTSGGHPYFQSRLVSQIPFVAMQTLMCCPGYKARFEILGSPFMNKKISLSAQDSGNTMQLDGNMTQGGFLEFQIEGNINVTQNALAGVYAQYTYESLKGGLTGISVDGFGNPSYIPTTYDFYTLRNTWIIGLNCNVPF